MRITLNGSPTRSLEGTRRGRAACMMPLLGSVLRKVTIPEAGEFILFDFLDAKGKTQHLQVWMTAEVVDVGTFKPAELVVNMGQTPSTGRN